MSNRGYCKENKIRIALIWKDGRFYKNQLGEIQTWKKEEDYIAESFNNYYLKGSAKIVTINSKYEIIKGE